jgi:AcrR family transcriptional regulator
MCHDRTEPFRFIRAQNSETVVIPAELITQQRFRPRIEGAREGEILDATLALLADQGYDRLTMDAVAAAAHASKATLYRRWSTKALLVVDAVSRAKDCHQPETPDTGTLRGDLLAMGCATGGLTDEVPMAVFAAVLTALHRDPEFAQAFQEHFVAPRRAVARAVFERAKARGEIVGDVDLDLLSGVLPAIALHEAFVIGRLPTKAFIEQVLDQVVIPATLRQTAG